jgi:predicted amidophosphoribosyltransferase
LSLAWELQRRCLGCLGPLAAGAQAGLCRTCWEGLQPLAEDRCPRCAVPHPWAEVCPDPVAWACGDALWDYHGGRPALGALLVPGIKHGELGWKAALLARAGRAPLPGFAWAAQAVCAAPTSWIRRWRRGFDLAEEAARMFAGRLGRPLLRPLRKRWLAPAQAGLPESRRRRLGRGAVSAAPGCCLSGQVILLVDDVWTTGTTLLRAAQALRGAGAGEVLVLTLFRAWRRQRRERAVVDL